MVGTLSPLNTNKAEWAGDKKINKWTTVDLDTIQNIEKLQKIQTNYLNELLKMFIIIVIIAMTSIRLLNGEKKTRKKKYIS